MALDQGTTSSRCIIFDRAGAMRSVAQKEFRQHYPKPGWVEHDAAEIWDTTLEVARRAMQQEGLTAADIAAIGITNRGETTVVWDKATGEPVCPAIVWRTWSCSVERSLWREPRGTSRARCLGSAALRQGT